MKKLIRLLVALSVGLTHYPAALAQTLDPSFAPVNVQRPGVVTDALEQPDGKYLVSGTFSQINGTAATGLARLNADGTLDAAFTAAAAGRARIEKVRLLPNGQVLAFAYAVLVGGRTFNTVAKLNADGTVAADFNVGTGASAFIRSVAVQPDGKFLLAGDFYQFNGVKSPGLVRLNANGSVDQAFSTALGNGFVSGPAGLSVNMGAVVVQPDGKIVVGGRFENYQGTGRAGLVRLLADGSLDTSFNPVLRTNTTFPNPIIYALALDPRTNNIVVRGNRYALNTREFVRLLPSGQLDNTFTSNILPECSTSENETLVVDGQGRITYQSCFAGTAAVSGNDYLFRMLPSGQLDTQFAVQRQLDGRVASLRALADGNILIGGEFQRYGTLRNVCLVRLNDQAQASATFRPVITQPGTINALKVQPDGKILAGGNFSLINGQSMGNLARFNADGTLDAGFRGTGANAEVTQVLLQADGRIVVGGPFTAVDDRACALVGRLLPDGSADASFTTTASATTNEPVLALAQLPDGSLLVGGGPATFNNITGPLHRLSTAGVAFSSYNTALAGGPTFPGSSPIVYDLAVLADGRHYVAGSFRQFAGVTTSALVRLNATGSRDNTFSATLGEIPVPRVEPLPQGQVLIGDVQINGEGGRVARLGNSGALDPFFALTLSNTAIKALHLLPNGRILLGGSRIGRGALGPVAMLEATGSPVAGFSTQNLLTPYETYVNTLAVQPDGALLVAGTFTQVGGTARSGLARLTSPAILAVGSQQLAATTQAWPVPAHGTLHLSLDAAAQPRTVQLLDALGRAVLTQPVTRPQMLLPLAGLRAGVYLLRVEYDAGPVTRRVVVE
ncbi:T9SS type A sorting domain-containing protein [Hymenobacter aquaticus]|uniref:T9SS type A sorting domain-containing protein n=1 Tax=Hymenobacter aquaticus TaxID=1867101 RepID=A0A4Z0PUA0_9BACT|nr:T9SS type A sorting domain-containing protein [Hymenobacter aquaticus]TGE20473.1 T9SS type A sorting domain-containing protein [Hymenobacter aquaticus]